MKKILKLIFGVLLFIPSIALATPSSVDRITDHIQPLIQSDFIQAPYYIATSTTATSTFAGNLILSQQNAQVPNLTLGTGSNATTYGISVAGGRAMFGYDVGRGSEVLNAGNSKGLDVYVNGNNNSFLTGTNALNVSSGGFVGISSTTPTHTLSIGNFLSFDSTGVFNLGYSPIQMYQDAFGSLIHLTGNPGYYFPRMLSVYYAPPDNTTNDLGDQEAGTSFELPVNGGCFNGSSFSCAQGIEMGSQRYSKVGNNYYANENYINSYKRTTGTTTPIAISFENKDLNTFATRYVAEYLDSSGAIAFGGYASTTSNSANRYDLTIPLQVSSTTAITNFAVDSSPRTHLFVVNSNGRVGIATSSPSQLLTVYSTSATPSIMISNTNTGGAASLNISPDGTTASGLSIKQYGSAIGSGLNNTSEYWNFSASGNAGMRFGGSVGEVMRIDTLGARVGVGTSTPGVLLDIFSTGTSTTRIDSNSTTKGGCLVMKDSDGSGYTYISANNGVLTASTNSCQ